MRKSLFLVIIMALCLVSFSRAQDEETQPALNRIDEIRIHVLSSEIDTIQNDGELRKAYEAATASPGKNTSGIPFGRVGIIRKIVFNPPWYPPDSIRKEYALKNKHLPKKVPPGKNNPLGKIKLFISFNEENSDLGIHNTNNPKSIGKRVTHGCTRLGEIDVFEMARIILEQNYYYADEIFQKAVNNPTKTLVINIDDGPSVVHLKD